MKEAIGSTSLFTIVILFVLLFTGIMCLTINRSKAFAVKDDIVNYIEENNGIDISSSNEDIKNLLLLASYRSTGTCKEGFTGFDREGKKTSKNPAICINKVNTNNGSYYQAQVFYTFDIPVINTVFNFYLLGETKNITGEIVK